jgi:hypothetical protein
VILQKGKFNVEYLSNECVRAYFVQLERLSSFIQIKWIKHALAHLFGLHIKDNFYSTSGGIWRVYIPS